MADVHPATLLAVDGPCSRIFTSYNGGMRVFLAGASGQQGARVSAADTENPRGKNGVVIPFEKEFFEGPSFDNLRLDAPF